MNWLMAHRTAGIAATNLLGRLDLPEDQYVDVFTALRRSGLGVCGEPSPTLFGYYVPPQASAAYGGIFLNSTMSEATIRHTAAHELGHAEFGHRQCVADGLDPFAGLPADRWPDDEKQAEAFAAWFLMPIAAVKTALLRLGLDIPREAMDVYQLSLHLGTSYRGTLRHLQNLRMVNPGVARDWARVQPKKLRARLSGEASSPPTRVWDLGALTEGGRLPVEQGDRLVVRAPWLGLQPRFTGPAGVEILPAPRALGAGDGAEFDITETIACESTLTVTSRNGATSWSATLLPTPEVHEGLLAQPRAHLLIGPRKGLDSSHDLRQ